MFPPSPNLQDRNFLLQLKSCLQQPWGMTALPFTKPLGTSSPEWSFQSISLMISPLPNFPKALQDKSKSQLPGLAWRFSEAGPSSRISLECWWSTHTFHTPMGFLHSALVVFLQTLHCTSLSGIRVNFTHSSVSAETSLPQGPSWLLPAWVSLYFLSPWGRASH